MCEEKKDQEEPKQDEQKSEEVSDEKLDDVSGGLGGSCARYARDVGGGGGSR